LENNLKLNENLLINYLKIQKNILLIDNYFIIKADDGNLYIFQLLKENKEIKLMNVIYKNIPGYEILDINNIFIFKEINGNYFFLMENKYQTTNSVSILLTKNKFEKIETVYSDNIVKLQKALNCKSGFAFLVTKQYSKGIYQELYFYSMENNNIIKISGWENVTDKELELIKRIEK